MIGAEITQLLGAFPAQPGAEPDMRLRIQAYFEALGDAPAWAVQQARLQVIRGDAPGLDRRWAPTPPQFAKLVRDQLAPFEADLAELRALAKAGSAPDEPQASPEQRKRVATLFADLAKEMRMSKTPGDAAMHERQVALQTRGDARLFAAMCKRAGIDPAGGVSPALLKSLERAAE